MSTRSWIIAVALGLAVSSFVAWGVFQTGYSIGEQAGEYQANSDTYTRHAKQEIRGTCAGLDGVAQTECMVRVIEATNQHERAESDLVAQRNMARWALWMLIVTGVMAAVTAFGVYYVWRTLLATQKMAQDSREIGESQVRAHVRITGGKVRLGNGAPNMNDKRVRPVVTVNIKNYGQTPALWFQWSCIVRYTLPPDQDFLGNLGFAPESWGDDIGPGEGPNYTMDMGSAAMSTVVNDVFQKEETHLDIIIRYKFKDIFGKEVEDERVFKAYFQPGSLGTDCDLISHVFDRETIEQLICAANMMLQSD